MRALVEDTKKLAVNNNCNNNNNNNNSNSTRGNTAATTTATTTTTLNSTVAATKNPKTKVATKTTTNQQHQQSAKSKLATTEIGKSTAKGKQPTTVEKQPVTAADKSAAGDNVAKTSFTNKTYKMQQQQQQQQTTITNTTNSNTNTNKGGKSTGNCPSPPTTGVKLRTKQPQQRNDNKKENHNNNTTSTGGGGPTSMNTTSTTISLPKASHANTTEEIAGGVQDTIYLCNFRVSVDGEWLCLKELQDIDTNPPVASAEGRISGSGGGQRPYSMYSQKHKRYSAGDRHSYGGGGGFEDNGIFALHNFIAGRRLYDEQGHAFHTNMLTAPHARESGFIGVFGGGGGGASQSSNEWSNLCRLLFMLFMYIKIL